MPYLKALDCCSGLGGWSDGLYMEGFKVQGIEINPIIAFFYKHPVIVKDIRELDPSEFKGYDLIVGSPPCRDFSKTTSFGKYYWKDPPNPDRGLEIVNAFLSIVKESKPRFWLLENVPGLKKFLDLKPRVETRLGRTMKRCFWGNFPPFFIKRDYRHARSKADINGYYRKWKRAVIPLSISRALGKAVKNAVK